jgi:hypothetical protein
MKLNQIEENPNFELRKIGEFAEELFCNGEQIIKNTNGQYCFLSFEQYKTGVSVSYLVTESGIDDFFDKDGGPAIVFEFYNNNGKRIVNVDSRNLFGASPEVDFNNDIKIVPHTNHIDVFLEDILLHFDYYGNKINKEVKENDTYYM